MGATGRICAGRNYNRATAQTFPDVIVGLAVEPECEAGDEKGTEALSGCAGEFNFMLLAAQSCEGGATQNMPAEVGSDAAIRILDWEPRRTCRFGIEVGAEHVIEGPLAGGRSPKPFQRLG